jgi:S1-C subfamily serine protease
VIVNDEVKAKYKLSVDYGAYVIKGRGGEAAVTAGSAAQKAGIKEGDVILEIHGNPLSSEIKAGGAKITTENPLDKVIVNYNPGDKVILKVLRDGKETDIEVTLGERPQ